MRDFRSSGTAPAASSYSSLSVDITNFLKFMGMTTLSSMPRLGSPLRPASSSVALARSTEWDPVVTTVQFSSMFMSLSSFTARCQSMTLDISSRNRYRLDFSDWPLLSKYSLITFSTSSGLCSDSNE